MQHAMVARPLVAQARVVAGRRQARRVVRATVAADEDVKSMYAQFDSLLDEFDVKLKTGDKVTGRVFRVDGRGAYVDIGGKGAAFCPTSELALVNVSEAADVIQPSTVREFEVIRDADPDGGLMLSLKRIEVQVVWQRLRQMQEEGVVLTAKVSSANRGGLLVECQGVRGFIPTSQLSPQYSKAELNGQELPVVLLDVDEERRRLVCSNRRALQETATTESLSPGDVVLGTVQNVKPYGAFVDMGGMFGLLHISQMSAELIPNINNVVAAGDKIKVMVLGFDKEKNRFALTTKKLEPSPGDFIRNPQAVFDRAEEMAATFKARIASAEAAATQEGSAEEQESA